MAPKSPAQKKKPITLDDFASAIQNDYRAIRKDMATKADLKDMLTKADLKAELWPLQRDIKTLEKNLRELRDDVQTITEVMVSKADLANTLSEELAKSEYARQLQDVRNRVDVLERQLGIKPTHRAA